VQIGNSVYIRGVDAACGFSLHPMRSYFVSVVVVVLFACASPSLAQNRPHDEKPLNVQGILIQPGNVTLKYDIPYAGMVEVRVLKPDSQLVWRNQYIQSTGENEIRFGTVNVRAGEYLFKLSYKGRDTYGSFTVAGGRE
jgi:hypothetical protein